MQRCPLKQPFQAWREPVSFSGVELQRQSFPARTEEYQLPTLDAHRSPETPSPFPPLDGSRGKSAARARPGDPETLQARPPPPYWLIGQALPTSVPIEPRPLARLPRYASPAGAGPREASGASPGRVEASRQAGAWMAGCAPSSRCSAAALGFDRNAARRHVRRAPPGCAAASLSPSGGSGELEEKKGYGSKPVQKDTHARIPDLAQCSELIVIPF